MISLVKNCGNAISVMTRSKAQSETGKGKPRRSLWKNEMDFVFFTYNLTYVQKSDNFCILSVLSGIFISHRQDTFHHRYPLQ